MIHDVDASETRSSTTETASVFETTTAGKNIYIYLQNRSSPHSSQLLILSQSPSPTNSVTHGELVLVLVVSVSEKSSVGGRKVASSSFTQAALGSMHA